MKKLIKALLPVVLLCCAALTAYTQRDALFSTQSFSLEDVPEFSGEPYVVLEDNQPAFDRDDLPTTSYETYSPLDLLGRCGPAEANVGTDLMPTEERGEIGQVKPSGWQTVEVRHCGRPVSLQPLPPDRLPADRGKRQRGKPHHRHPLHECGGDAAL